MRYILVAFAVLPFLIGIGFIVKGVRTRREESDLRGIGVPTVGTVVENRSESRSDGQLWYLPVVEFSTSTGRKIKGVGDTPSRRSYVTGTAITVVYDPTQPSRFVTGGGSSQQYLVAGVLFVVFGVIAAVVVGLLLRTFDSLA